MSELPPPVFIVGHWRSGTTFLYSVLSRSPDFGYIPPFATALPWDFLGLARWLRPLLEKALPDNRFIDRIPVRPDSPQEDETALANMQPISFYHGLYFPRRFRENFRQGVFFDGCSESDVRRWEKRFVYFVEKLHLHEGGKRLLVKNPVYTARVARLRELWPGAKIIHIYRNPYRVFQSTQRFYRKLFPELALQAYDHVPVDEVILSAYPRMMERLTSDLRKVPEEDYVEVRFEEFEANPLGETERIYEALGLEGFERARSGFEAYIESVSDYQKNRYTFPPGDVERVRRRWKPFIERWGYEPPG